ncbi:tyrosine-type recombinase/integrase [Pelagibacterium halotolerans]|uniref:tyrosine-type recombinase/integrase n=1 Tax=Pelagibacterium halotolerans TaxID=531813 RepID=UPI00384B6970
MPRKRHHDRFLQRRGDRWQYVRRVPGSVADLDSRSPLIRKSLKTHDLAVARVMRNALERADDELWASLLLEENLDAAQARYRRAVKRAEALGFRYRTVHDLAANGSWDEISERMEAISQPGVGKAEADAVLGVVEEPAVLLSKALEVCTTTVWAKDLKTKSAQQLRKWKAIPSRAVARFKSVVGDKPIAEITREDAQTFYKYWLERIAPPEQGKAPTHTPNSGNREIGELRKIYRDYFAWMNQPDRLNPFAGLHFSDTGSKKRPSFETRWITEKLLKVDALAGMNAEARGIMLAVAETGARPSEICNLLPEHILVDAEVPHIVIDMRDDPEMPRELKTAHSRREIPLVGMALDVFKHFPKGFPRYFEREEAASAAINKFLRENGLLPTEKHTFYSLRHSFEDRLKEANIDLEMRQILMGHRRSRTEYGMGGSLAWRRTLMERVALAYDKGII